MDKELEKKELGLLMKAKTALRYLAYERKYRAYIPSRPLIPFESRLIRYVTAHDIDFIEYKDHLKMIEKLGLPREQKYLYPDDFRTVHEELANRIRFENQKALREKAERRRAEAEKMIMKKDGYVIKLLIMPEELREEGKKMHHCVGSYAEKSGDRRMSDILCQKRRRYRTSAGDH